jgi:hypothetical protein
MALGLRGDRFLQILLHRRPQQPGGGPFIAAASDDASHRTIIRLCRMKRQGDARIRFEWRDGDAYNVEIVDYH